MKKRINIALVITVTVSLFLFCLNVNDSDDHSAITPFEIADFTFPNDSIFNKSLISGGNNYRMQQFISKCKSSKTLNVGFIGGSITDGAAATSKSNRFSSLFCEHIKSCFNTIETIHEINAGIGATHSRFGCSRVKEDLLQHKPDLIIIEFAVNDWDIKDTSNIHKYMEGLIRQCLNHDSDVPVVLLFFARGDGTNVQSSHINVGLHYSLPMISYRDAVWPIIEKNREKNWGIFFYDDPHPSDNGHKVCASLLYTYLKSEIDKPASESIAVPPCKYSDFFEKAYVLHTTDPITINNENWIIENREMSRVKIQSDSRDSISFLSFITNSEEISFGIHMQTNDTSSILIECNGKKNSISNFYVFEYTRFFSMYTGNSKTCTITHKGPHRFTIDYVLLSN
ncbi:MAG: SGNH/GDSL hydrolase family protein [Chitinispirillaceae bacterium]|nr:SGNH/GDSL hydrolase family protein [Chitinispirillaceae bacterium]